MSDYIDLLKLHMEQDAASFARIEETLKDQNRTLTETLEKQGRTLTANLDELDKKLDALTIQQAHRDGATKSKKQMSGAFISAITAITTSTITALIVWAITKA